MRCFILDHDQGDRVVFVGDARDKAGLVGPRYERVAIKDAAQEPPEMESGQSVHWDGESFRVEGIAKPALPVLDLASPTLAKDLARLLAARGFASLKGECE